MRRGIDRPDSRVALRPFAPGDASELTAYLNRSETSWARYVGPDNPVPLARAAVERLIEEWSDSEAKSMTLALVTAANGEVIGHASAWWGWDAGTPDMAIVVDPRFRGRGFGRDAGTLILRYLFEDTMAWAVHCWIDDWNESGIALATSLGFRQAGRSRCTRRRQGEWVDSLAFDLLRSEFEAD
ncbi:MAG: GNAT family N-acetyltransferase [Acidimicrobiia bacterium]|nr:GNAT family N-acetyltransferase [Acidimicrobiia bacterium]